MLTRFSHTLLLYLLLATSAIQADTTISPAYSSAQDGWDFNLPEDQLSALCERTLGDARSQFKRIEEDTAPATLQRVFGAQDAMLVDLQAIRHIWYLKSVHPEPSIQAAAEQCIEAYSDFTVSMNLSPKFYLRVAAINPGDLKPAERFMLEKRLRNFRQAGVDRDLETRERVRALVAKITELGSLFARNIREDHQYVLASKAQLADLPEDFLKRHPEDDNGLIHISTDSPDYFPVMKYSADDGLRRELYIARRNIATPVNEPTLKSLIETRAELATLLDYDSHAALAMDGLMIENPDRAADFLSEIANAVGEAAEKDMAILLERLQKIDAEATQVQAWQTAYLSNLVKQEQYALEAREIREYFHFDRVQQGVFELTESLFGIEIIPWLTQTWHKDVTSWEIREEGQAIGRFYLDMHPRPNKYKHAAHWTLRRGLKGGQLPLSGMATNFPRGLMEHSQVETFLHEFGHLLHNMFASEQEWLDIAGMSMERDFVEAPSQMLEEWIWDYDTLRHFALNDEGQPIPRELVHKMNRTRHFGEAAGIAAQLFYAQVSLNYYNRDPDSFELLPLLKVLQLRYSPVPYVRGTHFYNNFGHLNGYSSNYYIYQWSRAISTDLFSRFKATGLDNTQTADAYRHKVLAPGGSKPAAEAVADFLGRAFSTEAYREYLLNLGNR